MLKINSVKAGRYCKKLKKVSVKTQKRNREHKSRTRLSCMCQPTLNDNNYWEKKRGFPLNERYDGFCSE